MAKSTKKSSLAVGTKYDSMTVVQLKDLAKKKNIKIPSGTNKPGIIQMLIDRESTSIISKEKPSTSKKSSTSKTSKKVSSKKKEASSSKVSPKKKIPSSGTLKGTQVGALRKICKEMGIKDCEGSRYIGKADLIKIFEKYQQSLNKQEKQIEDKAEKVEQEKKKVEKKKKEVAEKEKKVDQEKKKVDQEKKKVEKKKKEVVEQEKKVEKIIEKVVSGELSHSDLKCLDREIRCKGRTSFCDTETGECKGGQYKGPKGAGYAPPNKEYKIVGLKKNVDAHVNFWSKKPEKKTVTPKPKTPKFGKCDAKKNPLKCKDDEVCYKSKCENPNKIEGYSDKYILRVEGRTIVADDLEKIQQLQKLLGGDIEAPAESEELEEETSDEDYSEKSEEEPSEEQQIIVEGESFSEEPEQIIAEKEESSEEEEPQEGGLSQKMIDDIRKSFSNCLSSLNNP